MNLPSFRKALPSRGFLPLFRSFILPVMTLAMSLIILVSLVLSWMGQLSRPGLDMTFFLIILMLILLGLWVLFFINLPPIIFGKLRVDVEVEYVTITYSLGRLSVAIPIHKAFNPLLQVQYNKLLMVIPANDTSAFYSHVLGTLDATEIQSVVTTLARENHSP